MYGEKVLLQDVFIDDNVYKNLNKFCKETRESLSTVVQKSVVDYLRARRTEQKNGLWQKLMKRGWDGEIKRRLFNGRNILKISDEEFRAAEATATFKNYVAKREMFERPSTQMRKALLSE